MIKNLYNRIFNRWTKWELYEANKRYEKWFINPMLGYQSPRVWVTVDVYVKTNKYTGLKKYKKVEKK